MGGGNDTNHSGYMLILFAEFVCLTRPVKILTGETGYMPPPSKENRDYFLAGLMIVPTFVDTGLMDIAPYMEKTGLVYPKFIGAGVVSNKMFGTYLRVYI